ncbi:MAG: transaldolase [Anaerolineae bacterium]|nr:transaldolase [Anaerolineae bacterium]
MADNPLLQLREKGQSVWLDNIDRRMLTSGELQRLVESGEVQGVTSNPTIFQKAISTCAEYDPSIRELAAAGADAYTIWENLSIADIRAAAAILEPVYEATDGRDGYVSIEVAPSLAHDVDGTITEATRLFTTIARPNVMIKVPATQEGVRATAELIGEGVNVNATLIFSPDNYEQIARAYIAGLERLAERGTPVESVASVASIFVSRIDTAVDRELEARLSQATDVHTQNLLRRLLGQAAIANCKVAYQRFRQVFSDARFVRLQRQGARVQRPLWASTSTKNPAYRDVVYVEELIGPDTVNTMPPGTLAAFRDHGRVRLTLEENVDYACRVLEELTDLGIDMDHIYAELQADGVKAFADSLEALLGCIRERVKALSVPEGEKGA